MHVQWIQRGILLVLMTHAFLPCGPALAQVNSWISPNAGKWETPGNWSLGVAPTNSHSALITNAFSKTVTIDATTSGSFSNTMTVNNLTVSAPSGSANTLFFDNSGLATPFRVLSAVSISNNATLLLFGNTVFEVGTVSVSGTMNVEGGGFVNALGGCFMVTTNAGVSVGTRGTGSLVLNSSTWFASGISVGGLQGSSGTLTIQSGTNLNVGAFDLGTNPGATGIVLVADGEFVSTNAIEARLGSFGQGRIVITNGLMRLGNAALGKFANARGTLTVSNGMFSAATLTLAPLLGTTGTVTMVGGTFEADRLVATNTAGVINFLGGTMTLRGAEIANNTAFIMGSVGRTATLNFPAGTNRFQLGFVLGPAGGSGATNTVFINGGHWVVTNGTTTVGDSALGQVTVSNGSWRARDVILGRALNSWGTLAVAGGTNTLATDLRLGTMAGSTGVVLVTGGQLTVTNASTIVGENGVGQFTALTNGTYRPSSFHVGLNSGSRGTFTIAGASTELSGGFSVGENAGAIGSVLLDGGTLIATNLGVFESVVGVNGTGQMTVSNGLFQVHDFRVGRNAGSQGSLTIAGGTNVFHSFLSIAPLANATGSVLITGGQVVVTNSIISIGAGLGTLTVAGGTVTASAISSTSPGNLVNFPGGTMTLRGAEILSQDFVSGGAGQTAVLNLLGGTSRFAGDFGCAGETGSTGTILFDGDQLIVGGGIFTGLRGIGQMTVSNGTCRTGLEMFVGVEAGSHGTVTIAGGTTDIGTTWNVGSGAAATGAVFVTGGQLLVTNGVTSVGRSGVGRMTVSNGAWRATEVIVGHFDGSDGMLTIAGGTNVFSSRLVVSFFQGSTGTVLMTGGTLIMTNLSSNFIAPGGVGRVTVSNGTMLASTLFFGDDGSIGQGTMTIAGGDVTLFNRLILGFAGNHSLLLNGGSLTVTNDRTAIASFDVGRLTVSNGTWRAREVEMGLFNGSQAFLTVAGGTSVLTGALTLSLSTNSTGVVSVTGGQLIVTNAPTFIGSNGVGQVTISNGTWRAREVTVAHNARSQGALAVAGGISIFSNLTVATSANSTGTVLMTGGQLIVTNDRTSIGQFGVGQMTVSGGTLQAEELIVANNSRGTLTIAGGTNLVKSEFRVGFQSLATGTVSVTGGRLVTTNQAQIGLFGRGDMTVSSGTWLARIVSVGEQRCPQSASARP
jgi:T5SS/PEP-CTERM-associated repeat protein